MSTPKPKLCEEDYFNTFYLEHIQAASNFAYFKCGNSDTSLDYVQDAFQKIWGNCSKIDPDKAKTYLFTTINNLFLNHVRHNKVVLAYAKAAPYKDQTNLNPQYLMEEDEFKKKLLAAIEDLSADQREVFLLNRIEDKKYKEIAELLNISQKTVEKRMSAALKIMREKIDRTKF
ncbi:RNA polymerase sigma-70 factor (ECF subfamily) [Gelidibacter sediminis]|uniref:RNA polymerase sigma-70 factor (ECF subfamily) n=1 Tax=Gelidibacter sediminis TaxID=1608710 RepID=A0A4R7Q0Q7_9FLAO|nr:sigma-70 family RNA polymerase sigma factor [Gelidibacter sediminis]TDU40322.1 RNA polymerase sigma-70 factor (ECF subfamily) [Gelidibacter sediminis]